MTARLRLPRQRATTATVCSAYPFHAQAGLGDQGVYLGTDLLAGGAAFTFDPFHAYTAGTVTNANIIVAGDLGTGKSATVKAFVYRSVGVFGRWCAIVDPKGEYGPLADALDLTVLKLHPGGACRLNPLDNPNPAARHDLLAALTGSVLGRDLLPIEDAVLSWTVDALGDDAATLPDLARLLQHPTGETAARASSTPDELAQRAEDVALAVGKLCDRSLRGMFDGPTTTQLDPDGRGVVIDISAVHHDPAALALVMAATTTWLQTALNQPGTQRRIQVLDEAWALLADPRVARHLQACWKLGRALGVCNLAVIHRLSDLRAQTDDGTATSKVTAGLLADTQTRVVFRQAADQRPDAQQLLGLTGPETELIGRLVPHRALWKIGGHTAVVHHALAEAERPLVDTDGAMRP